MRRRRTAFIAVASTIGLLQCAAMADSIQDFGVFGGTGVTFAGGKVTGKVGSNSDINDQGSIQVAALQGLGNFNGSNGIQKVAGAVAFNGDVSGGPLSSYGSVDAGGNVSLQGSVTGNITAGKDLLQTSFDTVGGNALVGGNATLGSSNVVSGTLGVNGNVTFGAFSNITNLIYGGSLSGTAPTVGSQQHGTVVVQPQTVASVSIPAGASFVGGGADQNLPVFAHPTLAPGHYGALNFAGGNAISLSAGNYYFDSISSAGDFLTLNLDLSGGDINIFVTGSVDLLAVNETVNGLSLGQVSDLTLASKVYLEAHGPVTIDHVLPANGSRFFGTIFDPTANITTGANDQIFGALLSGQTVVLGDDTTVTVEPAQYLTQAPEPGILSLLAVSWAMFSLRPRRALRKLI